MPVSKILMLNETKESINNDFELYALVGDDVRVIDIPEKRAILAGLHEGLPLGVYTAMRTFYHNKFLHLGDHLARLEKSIALLGWKYPLNGPALRQGLHQVCTYRDGQDARVRIDVLAEEERRIPTGSRVLISLSRFEEIPGHIFQKGVRVGIEPSLSRNHPEVKKAEFAVKRRRYLEHDPARYECLIIDKNKAILEGTTSNFFGVFDGILWTAGRDVLEGIARKIILKLASEAQIPVQLDALRLDALPALSESALSSASRGLVPIVRIGEISRYADYVVRNIRTAI